MLLQWSEQCSKVLVSRDTADARTAEMRSTVVGPTPRRRKKRRRREKKRREEERGEKKKKNERRREEIIIY